MVNPGEGMPPLEEEEVRDGDFQECDNALENLLMGRKYIRQRITYIHNSVDKSNDNLTVREVNQFQKDILAFKPKLDDLNMKIFSLSLADGKNQSFLDTETSKEVEYEFKIQSIMDKLNTLGSGNKTSNSNSDTSKVVNKLKLPEVKLPSFSNTVEESLEKFLYEFESILGKHELSSHEKFIYLKNQLTGSPRTLIDSLDVTEQKYSIARDLLVRAFASTLVQKYNAIEKLSQMRLEGDPYTYVGQIKTIINSFKHLKIDVDTIIQYFVWNGFSDEFQTSFIQIVNNNTPSLDEINANLFKAIDRAKRGVKNGAVPKRNTYSESKKVHEKSPKKMHNYAINVKGVKNGHKRCSLCSNDSKPDDHYMRDCPVYDSAKKKVSKLKSMKACSMCSFTNHRTSECRFVFKAKCGNCQGNHFSYLCLNDSGTQSDSTRSERIMNKVSSVEVVNCNFGDESVILPTLSCKIRNDSSPLYRAFKDGGCQRNFILTKLANKQNLEVVRDSVTLNIEGFNSCRTFTTKVVKVPLFLDEKTYLIDAICIPQITTKLHVKNLHRVVDIFRSKGYKLADQMLCQSDSKDIVSDISLILGTDSDHLLELNYKMFGTSYPKSSYISSQYGVLLSGNVGRMLHNIDDLPEVASRNNVVRSYFCETRKFPSIDSDYNLDSDYINVSNFQCISVLNSDGQVEESKLKDATENALKSQTFDYVSYGKNNANIETETNIKLVNYVLDNTVHLDSGHLEMPLPWNSKIVHLLGHNFNLSRQILMSNLNKLKKCPEKLKMYDDVFQEQLKLGIIEKVDDINSFIQQHPESSFLAHMGVFKMNNQTSKCRPVFLSNLCEKNSGAPNAVSHNQAMLPGPSLNHKITTALLMLRFDKFLLTFDVKRAFLNIALREADQMKLMFLWFRNVSKGDYTIVGFKNLKLSFGLRASPCILMLAMFKILILDVHNDDERIKNLKKHLFNIIYMDNAGYSTNSDEDLKWAYEMIPKIFETYSFFLQQFYSNSEKLQFQINRNCSEDPPEDEVKLLGMKWNRLKDSLLPVKIDLNPNANTKRSILSSFNSIYDVFGIYSPILNRARLFVNSLLNDPKLKWDTRLSDNLVHRWQLIVKQVNKTPQISIPRSVGRRDSEYQLIAFSDASKSIYGAVIYIRDMSNYKVSYLASKNRVVSEKKEKTIPVWEFTAICLGVEFLQEIYNEFTCESTAVPLQISKLELFTDSMVSLQWVRNYAYEHDKMQKHSVYIQNRLKVLNAMCENFPVTFNHINGKNNPADYVTRETSYSQIIKTDFYSGPKFLSQDSVAGELSVTLPNPLAVPGDEISEEYNDSSVDTLCHSAGVEEKAEVATHLILPERYSSITKLIGVYGAVLKFVHILKNLRLKKAFNTRDINFRELAFRRIIAVDQKIYYPELSSYFHSNLTRKKDIPEMVNKFNLILQDSVIKVKGKIPASERGYPVLLHKKSYITTLIIRDAHINMSHIGTYTVLKELRPYYFIPQHYSTVKRIIKNCVICKKLSAKCVEINQNSYRDFRLKPNEIPFSTIFIDYAGPWTIKINGQSEKVWLLVFTCCWSRAVNIKICYKLDVAEFLRAIQLHIFEHGLFTQCISDLGSQICAGTNIISNFLDDMDTKCYLQSHGINRLNFAQFPKGNSALGSLVESCVKQVKLLISKSISKNILDFKDFEFIIMKVIHLINRRPIASHKDILRSPPDSDVPVILSPEVLLKGRELVSVNVIPQLQPVEHEDPEWLRREPTEYIEQRYTKLRTVRSRLTEYYHEEFLSTLVDQSVSKQNRYTRVNHTKIAIGDIVLLKDKLLKQSSYPMGVVKKVEENSLGEVTAAYIKKGSTAETVYRHVSSLILLIKGDSENRSSSDIRIDGGCTVESGSSLNRKNSNLVASRTSRRKAAAGCREFVSTLNRQGLI